MHLITMKCPACAANVSVDNDNTFFKCEYCQNQISIIKPTNINTTVESLNEAEQKTYSNFISILEQSMKAGNYLEAYNYCNKALEINPKAGSLWENKAICSFWLSSLDSLSNDKANEITTYLNASRQNDPNSKTYENIAETIANNLYVISIYRYNTLRPDVVINGKQDYSKNQMMNILNCLNMIELCYQIYPRVGYLKKVVELLTNGNIKWINTVGSNVTNSFISSNIGFDAKRKRDVLIRKIQAIDKNYQPPEFSKPDLTVLYIIMIFVFGLILLSVLVNLFK